MTGSFRVYPSPRVDHAATTTELLDDEALQVWDAAWEKDPDATLFHHSAWARLSISSQSAAAASLICGGDDAVCAVKVDGDVLRFLTDAHVTDLASPIGAPDEAPAIFEGMEALEGWTSADLDGFSGLTWAEPLLAAAVQAGHKAEIVQVDTTPRIPLSGTFDDYLASIEGKQRHEIRRKGRKLERDLAPWRSRLSDADTLQEDVEAFIEQHRLAAGEKGGFMTPEHAALFRRAASETMERGWLRLSWLETEGGSRLAAVWSYLVKGRWLVWNSSFDPAYRELSTGMVAMSEAIRLACEERSEVFDLLRGDEAYKYRLGAVDHPVNALRMQRVS